MGVLVATTAFAGAEAGVAITDRAPAAAALAVPSVSTAQLADPVFMEDFYRTWFPRELPPLGYAVDDPDDPCDPGHVSDEFRDAELSRLNALRALAGVPSAVVENPAWQADAQAGAASLVRDPVEPQPGDLCYSQDAQDAIDNGTSAGYLSDPSAPWSVTGIDFLMADLPAMLGGLGTPVDAYAPARDLVVWPQLSELAVGVAPLFPEVGAELFSYLDAPNTTAPRPAVRDADGLVMWPPCGSQLPYQLAAGPWSVSRPGLDTDGDGDGGDLADVTITRNGQELTSAFLYDREDDAVVEESSKYAPAQTRQPESGVPDDYRVTIDGATQDGAPTTISCEFSLIDVNFAPTAIDLYPGAVGTNAATGSDVGTFDVDDVSGLVDNGEGSTYSYALVDGEGDEDNDQFAVVDDHLVTSAAFDRHEGERSVRVRVTEDRPDGVFEQSLTIDVAAVPAFLDPISPTEASVDENQPAGTVVATFPEFDDNGETIEYSIEPEAMQSSALFVIVGNRLVTTAPLDAESMSTHRVTIRSTNDSDSISARFTVRVADLPEEPGRPKSVAATSPAPGELDVTWTPPSRGASVASYTVGWLDQTAVVDGAARSLHIDGLPEGTTVEVTVTATNEFGSASTWADGVVGTRATWPTAFTPIGPARLLDTRTETAIGYAGTKPGADKIVELQVAGIAGVPADAEAVALNVTATAATGGGYVTVFPTGTALPNASNLNVEAGGTVANSVIVEVGEGGKVSLYTSAGTHLIVDVAGSWMLAPERQAAAGRLLTLTPSRILDTRSAIGRTGPKPVAGESFSLPVLGKGGIPATGVSAVVLNVTATGATAPGYVTVWPSGQARPNASNLNLVAGGQTVANQVIVPVGADGSVALYTEQGTHLIADVSGYITDAAAPVARAGLFVPTDPFRELDSRSGTSPRPAAGQQMAFTSVLDLPTAVPPADIGAFALNVTATSPASAGYVSVYPCGAGFRGTSTLNVDRAGQTVPDAATAATNDVCVRPSMSTHLIVDVFGWYYRD